LDSRLYGYIDGWFADRKAAETCRVATHLEKSVNLRVVREKSGKIGKMGENSGKCVLACMKFGHLVVRKIIEIVATRCRILRLKCTKFDFGWVSAPDPTEGAFSAPQTP